MKQAKALRVAHDAGLVAQFVERLGEQSVRDRMTLAPLQCGDEQVASFGEAATFASANAAGDLRDVGRAAGRQQTRTQSKVGLGV